MQPKRRLCATIAASGVVIMLSAGAVLAQKGLLPPPQPETPPPVPQILQNYKPVTADRLKQPEDDDWLTYRRTYDGWGYSPLSQIANHGRKCRPAQTGLDDGDRSDRRPPSAADRQ